MVTTALMVIDPATAQHQAEARKEIVMRLRVSNVLQSGVDYGIVPGTAKPTLLKPGAERLCAAFGFNPKFETLTEINDFDGVEPLFFYRILCRLVHIESGLEVATGVGSCNSREARYRWRWVNQTDVPPGLDKSMLVTRNSSLREPAFAIEKAETTGKYGKPAAYWRTFKDAIANGTATKTTQATSTGKSMDAWVIGGLQYRIPNDDIFSLVNTVDKIACKRALIAATLIGANASEFFTQDVEDMPEFGGMVGDTGDVIEATFTEVPTERKPATNGTQSPPVQQEKVAAWATPENIQTLLGTIRNNIPGVTDSEIMALGGIRGSVTNASSWSQYGTGKAAYDAVMAAFEAGQPPAAPKSEAPGESIVYWTRERRDDMKAHVLANYAMSEENALELLDAKSWLKFASLEEAQSTLRSTAYGAGKAFVANSLTYKSQGKHHYVEFNTPVPVRRYSRDLLRALGEDWAAFAESLELGETYEFNQHELPPLRVTYSKAKDYATVDFLEIHNGDVPF